jgi:hypothetical protein
VRNISKIPSFFARHELSYTIKKGANPSLVHLEYPLKDLTIDQLRHLLRNLSVKGYCSATKFKCRMLLAHHVQFQKFYNQETNLNSNANLEKKLNSDIWKIQAFFHPDIFEQMMAVDNLTGRVDHENGTSKKQTWSALTDLYNSTDPDQGVDIFDCYLKTNEKNHLINQTGYNSIDLTNFTMTPIGSKEIKKFLPGLFKL